MDLKKKINNLIEFAGKDYDNTAPLEFLYLVGKVTGMIEVMDQAHKNTKLRNREAFEKLHYQATRIMEAERIRTTRTAIKEGKDEQKIATSFSAQRASEN